MLFVERLSAAGQRAQSTLAIGLAPAVTAMPEPMLRYDDPFLPFSKAVIDSTADSVCAYVFHLGAYLALGGAGAIALERSLAYVPEGVIKILHGPFASAEYVTAAFEDCFNADAVTLAGSITAEEIGLYLGLPGRGALVESGTEPAPQIEQLAGKYAGQIGSYSQSEAGHRRVTLPAQPPLNFRWMWGGELFAARGPDFRDALRAATLKLR